MVQIHRRVNMMEAVEREMSKAERWIVVRRVGISMMKRDIWPTNRRAIKMEDRTGRRRNKSAEMTTDKSLGIDMEFYN